MTDGPSSSDERHPLPVLNERVLPTLNVDGSRRWIRPKPFLGKYFRVRQWMAVLLMVLFAALPLIQIGGKPAILLDVIKRQFSFFGVTFHATDGVLLMLLLLSIFIGIFWITALLGRVWCGYACPQTVYLEFLFRPIERLLEGSRGQQLKLDREGPNGRRGLKLLIYAVLAVVLANVFLAYFVSAEQLVVWLTQSPFEHPTPFLVVVLTSGLVFFDFAYFREQMCTVICPYARLQSVLLDKRSLIIGYDEKRGEPRGRGRNSGGDCIDCKACVVACPTGIDIRDGLQLECIACAQCVDACDGVMQKIKKPLGLIRYGSQRELRGGKKPGRVRPRIYIYPAMLTVLVIALVALGGGASEPHVTVLRGIGAPFVIEGSHVRNQIRIKIHNRGDQVQSYHLNVEGAEGSTLIAPENPLAVDPEKQVTTTVFVTSPVSLFERGQRPIEVIVRSDDGFETALPYKLLGPM